MNRIKCLRIFRGMSQASFGQLFNVDQTAVSNWEKEKNSIDVKTVERIAEMFSVPMEFVYGKEFSVKRPMDQWYEDELEDYKSTADIAKDYLLFRFGKGYFSSHSDDSNSPEEAVSLPPEGMARVIVRHRDGKGSFADFTPEQVKLIESMIDAQKNTKKQKL